MLLHRLGPIVSQDATSPTLAIECRFQQQYETAHSKSANCPFNNGYPNSMWDTLRIAQDQILRDTVCRHELFVTFNRDGVLLQAWKPIHISHNKYAEHIKPSCKRVWSFTMSRNNSQVVGREIQSATPKATTEYEHVCYMYIENPQWPFMWESQPL